MTIKMIPHMVYIYDSEKQTPHGNMPGRGERGIDIAVKNEIMDPYTLIPHNFSRRKIHLLIFSIITRVCCFPCGCYGGGCNNPRFFGGGVTQIAFTPPNVSMNKKSGTNPPRRRSSPSTPKPPFSPPFLFAHIA